MHGLPVACAGLRLFPRGTDSAANATPDVDLIVQINRKLDVADAVSVVSVYVEVWAIGGLAHPSGKRSDSDCRIQRGVVEADQCASLAKPRIRCLQILIVLGYLWLKNIQLRVAEDLPPFSALSRIGRLSNLPVGVFFGTRSGSASLIRGRHRGRWLHILRPDHAPAEQQAWRQPDRLRDVASLRPLFLLHRQVRWCGSSPAPPARWPASRKGRESQHRSPVSPEAISTLAPESLPIFTGTNCTRPLRTTPTCNPWRGIAACWMESSDPTRVPAP